LIGIIFAVKLGSAATILFREIQEPFSELVALRQRQPVLLEAQKIGAQLVRNRRFGFPPAFLGVFITAADFTAELFKHRGEPISTDAPHPHRRGYRSLRAPASQNGPASKRC
jgi:hypothetical protein